MILLLLAFVSSGGALQICEGEPAYAFALCSLIYLCR